MTQTQKTWEEIRTCEIPHGDCVAYYNAPFFNGDDDPEHDCTVEIHIEGSDENGYILVTVDDADGPRYDAGRNVYPTAADAENAAKSFAASRA